MNMRRALTTPELRAAKLTRDEFLARPRIPIMVVLDGVRPNYNIGAIFRLCDAFLVQQLVICGTKAELHKRRLVQAAQGAQHWVPRGERQHAGEAVAESKARGAWVVVAEQTTARAGLSGDSSDGRGARWRLADVVEAADAAVVIPIGPASRR
jgi:tRNA G18 (ribose-2'-O)-methylase SpoU